VKEILNIPKKKLIFSDVIIYEIIYLQYQEKKNLNKVKK